MFFSIKDGVLTVKTEESTDIIGGFPKIFYKIKNNNQEILECIKNKEKSNKNRKLIFQKYIKDGAKIGIFKLNNKIWFMMQNNIKELNETSPFLNKFKNFIDISVFSQLFSEEISDFPYYFSFILQCEESLADCEELYYVGIIYFEKNNFEKLFVKNQTIFKEQFLDNPKSFDEKIEQFSNFSYNILTKEEIEKNVLKNNGIIYHDTEKDGFNLILTEEQWEKFHLNKYGEKEFKSFIFSLDDCLLYGRHKKTNSQYKQAFILYDLPQNTNLLEKLCVKNHRKNKFPQLQGNPEYIEQLLSNQNYRNYNALFNYCIDNIKDYGLLERCSKFLETREKWIYKISEFICHKKYTPEQNEKSGGRFEDIYKNTGGQISKAKTFLRNEIGKSFYNMYEIVRKMNDL